MVIKKGKRKKLKTKEKKEKRNKLDTHEQELLKIYEKKKQERENFVMTLMVTKENR